MKTTKIQLTAVALAGVFALTVPIQESRAHHSIEHSNDQFFGDDQSSSDGACYFDDVRNPKCIAQMEIIGASPLLCPVTRVQICDGD